MNGNPWLPDKHDPILKGWAGKITDKEIGTITGHAERTIRKRRADLGLPGFHWRRECVLFGAAGLFFATESVAKA